MEMINCAQCGASIRKDRYKKHLKKHGSKLIKCPKCSENLKLKIEEIKNHYQTKHKEIELTEGILHQILISKFPSSGKPTNRSVRSVSGGAFGLGKNKKN